tara:strand:+ start:4367 stop:4807 length:441 start_codon:yes stop_codon:yes gene_type:complete
MRLVFFQPDIPQNLGGAIRLAACFGTDLDVIEPCGFPLTDRALKRASLDYTPLTRVHRHDSWTAYQAANPAGRLVLFTTSGAENLWDFRFQADDRLLFGRESAGVTPAVSGAADARVRIPIRAEARSLNVTVSAGIALAEAVRQTR